MLLLVFCEFDVHIFGHLGKLNGGVFAPKEVLWVQVVGFLLILAVFLDLEAERTQQSGVERK